jgi:glycosyltransferase involved in cell wall biosynthesis
MNDDIKISACIIAFNEEAVIDDCLASVAWADEILLVDSGSTDRTKEIAERRGCRVIRQEFLGHVKQKDLAVREAQHRWVFCLDADERLAADGEAVIRNALSGDGGRTAGYYFPRRTFYLGGWVDHGGWGKEYRLRLFDRERGKWGGVDPHDRVETDGPTRRLDAVISHFNYRDIAHHMEKLNAFTSTMADRKTVAGEKASLAKMVFNPMGRFFRMFVFRQGFRDGVRGFVIAVIGAFYVFLKYAKLWEMQRIPDTGEGRKDSGRGPGAGN